MIAMWYAVTQTLDIKSEGEQNAKHWRTPGKGTHCYSKCNWRLILDEAEKTKVLML